MSGDGAARRPVTRNFYGRRHGKQLRPAQRAYLEDLETFALRGVDWDANPDRRPLDLGALFGGRPVWLEVGFGGGEHMVHQAAGTPGVGIIGCEPFINGVAMLMGKIRAAGVENLAVHPATCAISSTCCPRLSTGSSCCIPIRGRRRSITGAGS